MAKYTHMVVLSVNCPPSSCHWTLDVESPQQITEHTGYRSAIHDVSSSLDPGTLDLKRKHESQARGVI